MLTETLPAYSSPELPPEAGRTAVAAIPTSLPRQASVRPLAYQPVLSRSLSYRLLEMLPGAVALFLISVLVWGFIWFPTPLAIGLLVFDAYWLWKSWTIAYHAVKGLRLVRQAALTNWRVEYEFRRRQNDDALPWNEIKHVV